MLSTAHQPSLYSCTLHSSRLFASLLCLQAKAAAATAKGAAVKGYNVSATAIKGCLDAALAAWGKFDADGVSGLSGV